MNPRVVQFYFPISSTLFIPIDSWNINIFHIPNFRFPVFRGHKIMCFY